MTPSSLSVVKRRRWVSADGTESVDACSESRQSVDIQVKAHATFRRSDTAPTEADLDRTTRDRVCAFARHLCVSAREAPESVQEGRQRGREVLSCRRYFFSKGASLLSIAHTSRSGISRSEEIHRWEEVKPEAMRRTYKYERVPVLGRETGSRVRTSRRRDYRSPSRPRSIQRSSSMLIGVFNSGDCTRGYGVLGPVVKLLHLPVEAK